MKELEIVYIVLIVLALIIASATNIYLTWWLSKGGKFSCLFKLSGNKKVFIINYINLIASIIAIALYFLLVGININSFKNAMLYLLIVYGAFYCEYFLLDRHFMHFYK
jgi:hypothetical protein